MISYDFIFLFLRLDFEKELDKEERDGNKERILEIKGEREKVLNAEMKIKQLISEIPKVIEDEMLIPEETCGRIIGKGGQNIRELRSITGICPFSIQRVYSGCVIFSYVFHYLPPIHPSFNHEGAAPNLSDNYTY